MLFKRLFRYETKTATVYETTSKEERQQNVTLNASHWCYGVVAANFPLDSSCDEDGDDLHWE